LPPPIEPRWPIQENPGDVKEESPMRLRSVVVIGLAATVPMVAAGCGKKKAVTPNEAAPSMAVETASSPAPRTPEPAPPAAELDPLSGDLASVNAWLRERGLLSDVYFHFDRDELTPEARERLAADARFLRENPQFLLTLEGHCDERGTTEYNLALGDRRAAAVRSYLGSLGVPPDRLQGVSYGEERPVCSESDESCWRLNRRAHPMVTGRASG
jgi:peptidoglycan-associated lipoprotein